MQNPGGAAEECPVEAGRSTKRPQCSGGMQISLTKAAMSRRVQSGSKGQFERFIICHRRGPCKKRSAKYHVSAYLPRCKKKKDTWYIDTAVDARGLGSQRNDTPKTSPYLTQTRDFVAPMLCQALNLMLILHVLETNEIIPARRWTNNIGEHMAIGGFF